SVAITREILLHSVGGQNVATLGNKDDHLLSVAIKLSLIYNLPAALAETTLDLRDLVSSLLRNCRPDRNREPIIREARSFFGLFKHLPSQAKICYIGLFLALKLHFINGLTIIPVFQFNFCDFSTCQFGSACLLEPIENCVHCVPLARVLAPLRT